MSIFFNYNDKIYKEGEIILTADNRSFKYGDGLFETMKALDGPIILKDYHFQRLFSGLIALQFEIPGYFTPAFLEKKIVELCKKNKHTHSARIRLTVFRDEGLNNYGNSLGYIIQTWNLVNDSKLNTEGLIIDVYPQSKKSYDVFSNFKTNNFLPYAMGALYAKKNELMIV